jgi:hypothetical protein
VIAVKVAGFEKKCSQLLLLPELPPVPGLSQSMVQQKATRILVRIVKKLKNRMIVSATDAVLLISIR